MSIREKPVPQATVLENTEPLLRYLQKNANSADAADIFQEAVTRVLEQTRQKPILNPLAYAFTVARHLLMRIRNHPAEQPDELVCQSANPEEMASMQQTVELFGQTLAAMPALRRQVFVLYRVEGKSRSHIATLLQISEEAVSKHVSRALADIQRQIDQQRVV
ncbi:RNA polymerase sigma factor [Rheinheimera aquimaris]|uniref:RNA polymerase sigma factor n=1 Tax=Rheinheimera aquimaris TaxID=412437 RepID=A0ABN1E8W0_9GAMM|nr:sigma-70 family RNA polymerase sigma factor [Rheinheimera aquimaris]MCB5215079.1 sigma-70 family RNA polymerase sigma factor [Rheinheimera aquimaris]